jgi:lipopolysaccharide exporter
MAMFRRVNLKGDLFATAFSFCAQAVLKLGSSMILTRILQPQAYGIITILMSILFVVEMLSDLAVHTFIIRDPNGEEPRFLNTAWSIRLARSLINCVIVLAFASLISSLYGAPALTAPLRIMSVWFVLGGLESMSYPLAIRRKNSRVFVYAELKAAILSTAFTIVYCLLSRDYWGMVYGILVNRALITIMSHFVYPEIRLRLQIDREAARAMFGISKFALPSSLLWLAISQFDKIVFLRLFNLPLLGVYGLAGNIAGPIESLITKISQMVIYPRCAHYFRTDRATYSLKYYTENVRVFASMIIPPAVVGGAAQLIVVKLYDSRYAQAGAVLGAFMVRAVILSLASSAAEMLIATGEYQVLLVGNVLTGTWICLATFVGYYMFGFMGFVYGVSLSGVPQFCYFLYLQSKKDIVIVRYELYRLAFALVVGLVAYWMSGLILALWPGGRIRF